MKHFFLHSSVLLLAIALSGSSYAASRDAASKIYTQCTDNSANLAAPCNFYEPGSQFYQMCSANATASAVYTCQRYRVPSSYQGTYFENLNLSQYPKVGAPTAPQRGTAPSDLKGSLLGTLFQLH